MTEQAAEEWRLFDARGQRRYLCRSEGRRFFHAARDADFETRTFCRLLAYCGCRISEALAVTPRLLDAETMLVTFRTLKRRRTVYRSVPVPAALMRDLRRLARGCADHERLWGWSRQTAWRRVKAVMADAAITGPQAMPKALRHRFGVRCAETGMPPGLTQQLMGHAKLSSTVIYQSVIGDEERRIVRRTWR